MESDINDKKRYNIGNSSNNGKQTMLEIHECSKKGLYIFLKSLDDELQKLNNEYGENIDLLIDIPREQRMEESAPIIEHFRNILDKLYGIKISINKNTRDYSSERKTLYEILDISTKKELCELLESMKKDEVECLILGFGDNFDKPRPIKDSTKRTKFYRTIEKLKELKNAKDHPDEKIIHRRQLLHEYIGCTKKRLMLLLKLLSQEEVKLLKLRFGDNFDEVKPIHNQTIRIRIYRLANRLKEVNNDPDIEKYCEYYGAINDLKSIPFVKGITVSSFKANKKAISNLYGGMANVVVSKVANNHNLIKEYAPRNRELDEEKTKEYIQAIKDVRDISFTREIIESSLEIKNKELAFMLYGIPLDKEEAVKEPQFPKDLAEKTGLTTLEIERMRNLVSLGVLKRVKRDQDIIVNYETKKIGEEPTNPTGGKLVKNSSQRK